MIIPSEHEYEEQIKLREIISHSFYLFHFMTLWTPLHLIKLNFRGDGHHGSDAIVYFES